MPAITASAHAKAILVGEHAVVYGQPAIAFPIRQLTARTTVIANPLGRPDEIRIIAEDIQLDAFIDDLPTEHPFMIALQAVKSKAGNRTLPACTIKIRSDIPVASGLGSSAATSVSFLRAITKFIGFQASDDFISSMAYKVEVAYHGTPSGLDNTVIAHDQVVKFSKNQGFLILKPTKPLTFVVANSGITGNTKEAVSNVRALWQNNQHDYDQIFLKIGSVVHETEKALIENDVVNLGRLMNQNQELLRALSVSHPFLEKLIDCAIQNGAFGAKLSGGGLGGNIIAFVSPDMAENIATHLVDAGASQVIIETIRADRDV